MKKLIICHWYGDDKTVEQKTGFANKQIFEEYNLQEMIKVCFSYGYNVMLMNNKEYVVFGIAKTHFQQR